METTRTTDHPANCNFLQCGTPFHAITDGVECTNGHKYFRYGTASAKAILAPIGL